MYYIYITIIVEKHQKAKMKIQNSVDCAINTEMRGGKENVNGIFALMRDVEMMISLLSLYSPYTG